MRKLFTVMFLVLAVFITSCAADNGSSGNGGGNGGGGDNGGGGGNTPAGTKGLIVKVPPTITSEGEWRKTETYEDTRPDPIEDDVILPPSIVLFNPPSGISYLFKFNVIGNKNRLYMFTKNNGPAEVDFIFDLLFVQKTAASDGKHYGVTVSGDYIHSSGRDTKGVVVVGTGYWNVNPNLTDDAKGSLGGDTDYEIYMIVKQYGGAGGASLAGRNVIKIK